MTDFVIDWVDPMLLLAWLPLAFAYLCCFAKNSVPGQMLLVSGLTFGVAYLPIATYQGYLYNQYLLEHHASQGDMEFAPFFIPIVITHIASMIIGLCWHFVWALGDIDRPSAIKKDLSPTSASKNCLP